MPKESATLTNHVTMDFGDLTTECVANVPLRPDADHRDMPLVLRQTRKTTCPSNENAARNRHYAGMMGRLDIDGAFATCMTTMHPLSKNGKVSKISVPL
jgi:DNA (cytosine-5)-methyltransferase 1